MKASKTSTNSNGTSLQMEEDSAEVVDPLGTNSKARLLFFDTLTISAFPDLSESLLASSRMVCCWNRKVNKAKTQYFKYCVFVIRYGVEDMSECPKKIPFQPLGKFITQVDSLLLD